MSVTIRTLLIPLIGLVVSAPCLSLEITPEEKVVAAPTSDEILLKASEVYRDLRFYLDEGTVKTRYEQTTPNHSSVVHFTTAYSKSGEFRFEFWEPALLLGETRYVVWKNGPNVKSWWSIRPNVEIHKTIGSAISGATGVSGNSAYTVPSVLMPEAAWKGSTWTRPEGAFRVADGTEQGSACFRIQRLTSTASQKLDDVQTPATKGKATYWVSKDRFILMRIDEETDFGSFFVRKTTQYRPSVNSPIPSAAFEFGH